MIRLFHCCKDCKPPKRCVGCHATCEEYKESKRERDRQVEQERQDRKGLYQTWEMRRDSIEKVKRKNHDRKERK